MTIESNLSDSQKLQYFGLVTQFKVSPDVTIEHRGQRDNPDADLWAILSCTQCYNSRTKEWEFEPSPSNRTKNFVKYTRYSLDKAFEIVNSQPFIEYCLATQRRME